MAHEMAAPHTQILYRTFLLATHGARTDHDLYFLLKLRMHQTKHCIMYYTIISCMRSVLSLLQKLYFCFIGT